MFIYLDIKYLLTAFLIFFFLSVAIQLEVIIISPIINLRNLTNLPLFVF